MTPPDSKPRQQIVAKWLRVVFSLTSVNPILYLSQNALVIEIMKLRLVFIFLSPDRDEVIVLVLFRGTGLPQIQT